MRRSSIDSEVAAAIVAAVEAGGSLRQVAASFGISTMTVSRRVNDALMCEVPDVVLKVRDGSIGLGDRVKIAVGLGHGDSFAEIGRRIGFTRGAVGREVKRNGGRSSYDPEAAQQQMVTLSKRPRDGWIVTRRWLWDEVVRLLRTRKWSPEQISARVARDHDHKPEWCVSTESIYQAIFVQAKPELRKELAACLRSGRAKRVPHDHRGVKGHGPIAGMVNISERPAEVEDRAVPGHWEGDLILGKNGRSYVATLVERSTRFGLLVKLDNKTAAHVAERIAAAIKRLPAALARTLTWDQGSELADHQQISIDATVDIYFCDPHSPWQRGSNENWNGLVRQFLPKGTNLSEHSQEELDAIADLLNTRPRKTLGWDTPAERFNKLVAPTT